MSETQGTALNRVEFVPHVSAPLAVASGSGQATNPKRKMLDQRQDPHDIIIKDVKEGTGTKVVENGSYITIYMKAVVQATQEIFAECAPSGPGWIFEVGSGVFLNGLDKGVLGMKVSGRRVLVIPPKFAYGAEGNGKVPANATVVVDVILVKIE
ncbi:hypothetical protein B0H21DRAFT_827167 [Amylocystis lapponica]|nr:hypothetical protein B0H21DRAFT_827167 [Amylocystis lapponica]